MQFWFDITLLIWLTLNKPIATGVILARIHSNTGTNATCFSKVTSKRFIMGLPLQFQWQHFPSDRKSIRINHITVASAELLGRNDQSMSLCGIRVGLDLITWRLVTLKQVRKIFFQVNALNSPAENVLLRCVCDVCPLIFIEGKQGA